jgi:hypothetical protein
MQERLRYGLIHSFTLRKWYKRYELLGEKGLYDITKSFSSSKKEVKQMKSLSHLRKIKLERTIISTEFIALFVTNTTGKV